MTQQFTFDLTLSANSTGHFTQLSYDVYNQPDNWDHMESATYLSERGWSFKVFDGTTGTARNQVTSCSGVIGFNHERVVISTRGTNPTNLNDWITNIRFSAHPIASFFSSLFPATIAKLQQITDQFFGGHVHGQVANGFLQTHLSSWDVIKKEIMSYAHQLKKLPKHLRYAVVGHSKGAAKAQLNALHLVTDEDLEIGVQTLESEFEMPEDFVRELGLTSGFFGMAKKTAPKNNGRVQCVVYESPRVFDSMAAPYAEEILGAKNVLRIENRKLGSNFVFRDNIIDAAPSFVGFKHIGTDAPINGNGIWLARHFLSQVVKQANPIIDDHFDDCYNSGCDQEFYLPIGILALNSFFVTIFISGIIFYAFLASLSMAILADILSVALFKQN